MCGQICSNKSKKAPHIDIREENSRYLGALTIEAKIVQNDGLWIKKFPTQNLVINSMLNRYTSTCNLCFTRSPENSWNMYFYYFSIIFNCFRYYAITVVLEICISYKYHDGDDTSKEET
jgi:hypothetical protein